MPAKKRATKQRGEVASRRAHDSENAGSTPAAATNGTNGTAPQLPVLLPIDSCQPPDWNPNVEDLSTFNDLVETIKKDGFRENITVVASEDGSSYTIIAGSHRWKAAKLAGLTEIPALIVMADEDQQMVDSIRMNVLRGKFDPLKFTAIYNRLERKYGKPGLLRMLGMASRESEVQRLLGQVRKQLPEEMREDLDKRADKIRNVEDLAAVVQSLYAQYGSQLQHSFMVFSFGGQTHLMVQMSKETMGLLRGTLEAMAARGENANQLIEKALRQVAA